MARYGKCIDCACCDVENLKCYPNDRDCMPEYDLEKDDLTHVARCDFFKQKGEKNKIVRRVDDLGRIYIPKEIRYRAGIIEGDKMEIYIVDDMICLKRYTEVNTNETLG